MLAIATIYSEGGERIRCVDEAVVIEGEEERQNNE